MLSFQVLALTAFFCAVQANLFNPASTEKDDQIVVGGIVKIAQHDENQKQPEETALAVIENGQSDALISDDLTQEGESNGVVIRAKRYYGCGCGCCGCGTVAPVTAMPCGCGCCGCGYG